MMKKLPRVFQGRVKKDAGNNKQFFYSNKGYQEKEEVNFNENLTGIKNLFNKKEKNINQKINDIFNSPNYVYKADVLIKFDNDEVVKRIVGRNKNNLITIENELIPISKIIDIKRYDE